MSEKAFRIILAIVIVIWALFVPTPSVADFIPRAWASVQHLLPGNNPLVTVTVRDVYERAGIAEVRVQIITEDSTLVAITDKTGQAVFESVPAGRVREIRAQKLEYEIGILSQPSVPKRQRARFDMTLNPSYGRRLYVGHESVSGATSLSMLDTASRLVLSPPGNASVWDNVAAQDMEITGQRLHVLAANRLVVTNVSDGSLVKDLALPSAAAGFAAGSETVYVLAPNPAGRNQILTGLSASNWTQRMQIEVSTVASRTVLLSSPDGRRVYLAPVGDQQVSAYDTQAARRIAIYVIGEPIKDAALSPDGRTLYVLGERRQIPVAIDTYAGSSATTVLDRLTDNSLAGATRLLYAEQYTGRWLCLLQPTAQQVSVIDLRERTVRSVAVGKDATDIVAVPGSDIVFVANRGSNTLSLISLPSAKLIDTIDVRSKPTFLAVP